MALPHVEDFTQFEAFNTAVNIATEDLSTDDDGDEGTLVPHLQGLLPCANRPCSSSSPHHSSNRRIQSRRCIR